MESFATPYPVLFHDGDQEHDKGVVGVHSVLSFKRFQALMSQKTGIPANQLSAVFVCRRTLKDTDKRQKLPINENTNFNIILNQHNPSREKGCHFFVSIKKSKKERKGTRKRIAETENADDDDSNSSRGDLSPSDERPHPRIGTDEPLSPHFTSSPVHSQKFSSSPSTALPNENGQTMSNSSLNGVVITAAGEGKVELTLHSREGMGQNDFASPRPGWPTGGKMNHQVDGFSLPPAANDESSQSPPVHNVIGRRMMEGKSSGTEENVADPSTQPERTNSHGAVQQPQHLLQERFDDSTPLASRLSSTGLTRNSMQANNCTSRWSTFSSTPTLRTSQSSTRGASFNYSPKMAMGQSNSLMLQQTQAHLSQAQQQYSAAISPLEISQLSGVFRSLMGRENRVETRGLCKQCFLWQERNLAEPPFHWCVNDTITVGFRGPSPAGPIGRPGRRPVEAAI